MTMQKMGEFTTHQDHDLNVAGVIDFILKLAEHEECSVHALYERPVKIAGNLNESSMIHFIAGDDGVIYIAGV
jgi:hydrogenase maturation factor